MNIIDIAETNKIKIATKFKDFDWWAYNHLLNYSDGNQLIIGKYFEDNQNFGVYLSSKVNNELISRISFTNENIIGIESLDEYFVTTQLLNRNS